MDIKSKSQRSYIVLIPLASSTYYFDTLPPYSISNQIWSSDTVLSLDGMFFDYLRNYNEELIGFRYWLSDIDFYQHSIFKFFKEDGRFIYNSDRNYVDIFFTDLRACSINVTDYLIETIQDSDAEIILKNDIGEIGLLLQINGVRND